MNSDFEEKSTNVYVHYFAITNVMPFASDFINIIPKLFVKCQNVCISSILAFYIRT
jgi:hypothetical protein